jgi:DNA repair photolyase
MPLSLAASRMTRKKGQDAQDDLFQSLPPTLPVVTWVREPQLLLRPGPFESHPDVLSLHYVEGCLHGCPFCPVRGRIGEDVRLTANAAELLDAELRALPRLPRAVLLSPATDPFPPLNEVQQATTELVAVLARHGVDAWLMTRGHIRPAALEALRPFAKHVKVTVALTTLDRPLQRLLEPLTAPPRLRLRTLRALRSLGIACQAAVEPLVPGLTDSRDNLEPLLQALKAAGVDHVSVGYLILDPRTEAELRAALRPQGLEQQALDAYARGPLLPRGRGVVAGRALPRPRRQHGYAALMALGAELGLRVSVNAVTNPDFGSPAVAVQTRREGLPVAVVGR